MTATGRQERTIDGTGRQKETWPRHADRRDEDRRVAEGRVHDGTRELSRAPARPRLPRVRAMDRRDDPTISVATRFERVAVLQGAAYRAIGARPVAVVKRITARVSG